MDNKLNEGAALYNAAKETEMAANNSSANVNSSDDAKKGGKNKDGKKRKYKVQPVYSVMTKARRQFLRQVRQDTETKTLCIEANMPKVEGAEDALAIWGDFMTEAKRLMDSVRFITYCKDLGLNPGHVAEHLVFEGKSIVNQVLMEGPAFIGEKLNMFKGRICSDDQKIFPVQKGGLEKKDSSTTAE